MEGATLVPVPADASGSGEQVETAVLNLPEGSTIMVGEDGQQYVTMYQDGNTYAIPLAQYQEMQASGGSTITIQHHETAAQVTVQAATPAPVPAPPTATVVQQPTSIVVSNPNIIDQKPQIIPRATEAPVPSDPPKPTPGIKWSNQNQFQNQTSGQKGFKAIRVDNWGIFLLNRLQAYFQKKEYCDLTLRFPKKNAQIKVHKLVVNACTDFFSKAEKEGLLVDGAIDMPEKFSPEVVAPIVKFMYTGRLDLNNKVFQKLREAAEDLDMAVLTKLMDAQLNAPETLTKSKPQKRKSGPAEAVRQIKKIKKIEQKFKKQEILRQSQQLEASESKLPGKKLPFWKKRETSVIAPSQTTPEVRKASPVVKDVKPVISRQLREIQENLSFEKVRETTSGNVNKDMSDAEIKAMMEEQRRNLQEEDDYYNDHDAGLEYEEDEETEEMEEDSAPASVPVPDATPAKPILKTPTNSKQNTPSSATTSGPRKSVKFSLRPGSVPAVPKPVESELITSDIHTTEESLTTDPLTEVDVKPEVRSPPKKRGRPPKPDNLDATVEEFSKAVEEEELEQEEELNDSGNSGATPTLRSRRGRSITPKNLDYEPPKAKKTGNATAAPSTKPTGSQSAAAKNSPAPENPQLMPDQAKMIEELMKRKPELFKGSNPVRLKIMTKDSQGKNVVKVVTVKTGQLPPSVAKAASKAKEAATKYISTNPSPSIEKPTNQSKVTPTPAPSSGEQTKQNKETTETDDDLNSSLGLRTLPRVKYTGKRGRPAIIKPGESDPHAKERKEIEDKLVKTAELGQKIVIQQEKGHAVDTYISFEQATPVNSATGNAIIIDTNQLDPSSEAEALSHVASGIAASLGVDEAPQEEFNSGTGNASADTSGSADDEEEASTSGSVRNTPERAAKRSTRSSQSPASGNSGSEGDVSKKVVKLAMEWSDDNDDSAK